jgi:hypothetical protein
MSISDYCSSVKKGTITILLAFWPQIFNFNTNSDSYTLLPWKGVEA